MIHHCNDIASPLSRWVYTINDKYCAPGMKPEQGDSFLPLGLEDEMALIKLILHMPSETIGTLALSFAVRGTNGPTQACGRIPQVMSN